MDAEDPPQRLLHTRGLVLVEQYQRASGIDTDALQALVADGRVEAAYRPGGELLGFFDDVLPSTEQLRDWGCAVRDDYDPEALRSYEEGPDNGDTGYDGSRSSWTMGWEDQ